MLRHLTSHSVKRLTDQYDHCIFCFAVDYLAADIPYRCHLERLKKQQREKNGRLDGMHYRSFTVWNHLRNTNAVFTAVG